MRNRCTITSFSALTTGDDVEWPDDNALTQPPSQICRQAINSQSQPSHAVYARGVVYMRCCSASTLRTLTAVSGNLCSALPRSVWLRGCVDTCGGRHVGVGF